MAPAIGTRPGEMGAGGGHPAGPAPRRMPRWDLMLVWFMRLTALAWLLKGVAAWAQIVGALPDAIAFETLPVGRQVAVAYFAVIDCVAAVGLWLASAWGGVVWLFAATSALILAVFAPDLAPLSPPTLGFCGGSVLLYFTLSWLASRDLG